MAKNFESFLVIMLRIQQSWLSHGSFIREGIIVQIKIWKVSDYCSCIFMYGLKWRW